MKVKIKRIFLVALICLVLPGIFLAAECTLAKEKISVWGWGAFIDGVKNQMKGSFEKKYPDIEVEPVSMGPWDLMDKVLVSLAAGTGAPDVSELVNRLLSTYALSGGLLDLTQRASKYQEDVLSGAWGAQVFNGRVWAMGSVMAPTMIFYRRDLAEKYGIDFTSIVTWEEYLDIGKKVSVDKDGDGKPEVYLLNGALPSGTWGVSAWLMYFMSMGGQIWTADGKVIIDNELARSCFRFYHDLMIASNVATHYPVPQLSGVYDRLREDKILSIPRNLPFGASLLKTNIPEQSGKWAVVPWFLWNRWAPKYNSIWGMISLAIPKQTKYPEAAWKFVEFCSVTVEGQETMWEASGLMPTYLPVLEKSEKIRQPDPYFSNQSLFEAIDARKVPSFRRFNWAEAEVVLGNAIDVMYAGEKRPDDAWNWAEKELIKKTES